MKKQRKKGIALFLTLVFLLCLLPANGFAAADGAIDQGPQTEYDAGEVTPQSIGGGENQGTGGENQGTGGENQGTGGENQGTGGENQLTGGENQETGGENQE
ncbi:MAG: hypothetical protein J5927_03325, partial [Oscillospiraceae bacterium]|nr:hypothetical protein [Oscillospiraceae bacterium]